MKLTVKSSEAVREACDFLVLFEGAKRNDALGRAAADALKAAGRKPNQSLFVWPAPTGSPHKLLVIARPEKYQMFPSPMKAGCICGDIAKLAKERGARRICIDLASSPESEEFRDYADGLLTAGYEFQNYRETPSRFFEKLHISLAVDGKKLAARKSELSRIIAISEGVALARELVNQPPNVVNPIYLAEKLYEEAKEIGVKCKVYDEKSLASEGWAGHIAVGKGSATPPRMAVAEMGGGNRKGDGAKKLAFVGKGLTFDTGGISIKPWDGMWSMKGDMAGAAAVIGAFRALAKLGQAGPISFLVCCAENMPGGRAYRPSDIVKYKNGKCVEIISTDAEGRMVLADGLIHAGELGATHIVDIATLTGACVVALGNDYTGLIGNDDSFTAAVKAAAGRSGELVWELPLPAWYKELLKSEYCDFKNAGGRYGGAITAGVFLSEFVEKGRKWCHLDIAPTFMVETPKRQFLQAGGTGVAVRTLVELASTFGDE
ncbi:MAG: leucyl aminopeptidase [bacterium]